MYASSSRVYGPPGDVSRIEADVTDLVHDMDYKPSTTVEEGIGRFVEWYLGSMMKNNLFQ